MRNQSTTRLSSLAIGLALVALALGCNADSPDPCQEAIEILASCDEDGDPTVCASDSEAATLAFSAECSGNSDKADLFGHGAIGESCSWDWQCSFDSGLQCIDEQCNHLVDADPCALPDAEFQSKSGRDKQGQLFALHEASPSVALDDFSAALAALTRVAGMVAPHGATKITATFTHTCDVFAEAEVKRVHALGIFAKADLVITEDRYTGLLAEGRVPALIRFSIANPVLGVSLPSFIPDLEFIPGIGIKLLVDGRPSENIVAMDSLAGQGDDHNYFLHDFSNNFSHHAPTSSLPESKERYATNVINRETMSLVGDRFSQALAFVNSGDQSPFHRPMRSLADVSANGGDVQAARSPDHLVFRASESVRSLPKVIASEREIDFRDKLRHIPTGTAVFDIIAVERGEETTIGIVELTSPLRTSQWADREFFVQHSR